MKLTIKDKGAAMKAVDRLGGNQAKIRELQDENRKLRALFDEWAKAHPDEAFEGGTTEGRTESFAYRMEAAAPALKIQSHLTCEEVVAKKVFRVTEYLTGGATKGVRPRTRGRRRRKPPRCTVR